VGEVVITRNVLCSFVQHMDNGRAQGHKQISNEVERPVVSHHETVNAISSCPHSNIPHELDFRSCVHMIQKGTTRL